MKKKYNTVIVNREVDLQLRAEGDKINTLSTSELDLSSAPQGSLFKVTLEGGVTVDFYSNRKDQTSLSAPATSLPKFVKSPKLGKPTLLRVFGVTRVY